MGPARLACQRVTCQRARRQVRGERQRDFPSTTSLDRHLVRRGTWGVQRIGQVHRPADPVRDVGGLGGDLRHGHALLLQHQEARALGLDLLQGSRGLPGGRREGEHGEKSLLLPASIHYDVANFRIHPLHCFSHVIQGPVLPKMTVSFALKQKSIVCRTWTSAQLASLSPFHHLPSYLRRSFSWREKPRPIRSQQWQADQ